MFRKGTSTALLDALKSATPEQLRFGVELCKQLFDDALAERNCLTSIGSLVLKRQTELEAALAQPASGGGAI